MHEKYIRIIDSVRQKKGIYKKNIAGAMGVTLQGYRTIMKRGDCKISTILKAYRYLNISLTHHIND